MIQHWGLSEFFGRALYVGRSASSFHESSLPKHTWCEEWRVHLNLVVIWIVIAPRDKKRTDEAAHSCAAAWCCAWWISAHFGPISTSVTRLSIKLCCTWPLSWQPPKSFCHSNGATFCGLPLGTATTNSFLCIKSANLTESHFFSKNYVSELDMITSHNITHGFNGVCFSSNCPEDLVLCHLVGVQEAMGSRQGEEQRPQIPCVCVCWV